MPLVYDRFQSDVYGFVELPQFDATHDISYPTSEPQFTSLMGGGVFLNGALRGLPKLPYTVQRTGRFIESDPAVLMTKYMALGAAMWSQGRLWRRSLDGLTVQWKYAYLESAQASVDHAGIYRYGSQYALDVTLTFQIQSPLWNGQRHGRGLTLDGTDALDMGLQLDYNISADTFLINTTPKTFTAYTNRGNRSQRSIEFLVTVGITDLTQLILFSGTTGHRITSTVPVVAGKQLLIDTGRQAVEHVATLTSTVAPAGTTLNVDSSAKAEVGGSVSVRLPNGRVWSTTVVTKPNSTSVTVPEPGAPMTVNTGATVGFGAFFSSTFVPQLTWNQDDWFHLAAGGNDLTITRTGGGTALSIIASWNDAYA